MNLEAVQQRVGVRQPGLRWLALLPALALLALPQIAGRYVQYLTIQFLLLSLFSLGFNLLFGYTGLLSFGQAGFYAVGAYACAMILLWKPSLLLGVLGGSVVAAAVALVLGFFCVRHTRVYFSMLTLAFGMMIYSLAWKWRDVTGGDDGLVGIPRAPLELPGLLSIPMGSMTRYYYFVAVVWLLAVALLYRIAGSPLGLSLQAIRDSDARAAFIGIPVRRYRLIAFTIAGAYAGLAGALLPPLESAVTPTFAHWTHSAEPVLATLLGGMHSFFGPVVGAGLFILIKDLVVRVTVDWQLWMGIVVVALVMSFRGGVVSMVSGLLHARLGQRIGRGERA